MNPRLFSFHHLARIAGIALVLALGNRAGLAAASITQNIEPQEINIGDAANVTITVNNGNIKDFPIPQVDGLRFAGQNTSKGISIINGSMTMSLSLTFCYVGTRAGEFTIPAFDIPLADGGKLHVQAMKLHVLTSATAPASPTAPAQSPALGQSPFPGFNRSGPVVMPDPTAANPNPAPAQDPSLGFKVPLGPDGRPAPVFIQLTPTTTDAYVGETVPLRIEFYIRGDSDYQQNSLPTIIGSDFLMNDLSVHPDEEGVTLMNENYRKETWITAISAPKSGNFPLQMERDTYWVKSMPRAFNDPFGNIFGPPPQVAHTSIPSNQLIFHSHELPTEGRPDHFSGAIGQLKATATAAPTAVGVGEPVTIHFSITGNGNFNYIKCPVLASDPAWKTYTPSSKVQYDDESKTQGTKTFEQAIIPQKPGTLPLPACTFTYFDPNAKQYVSTPIDLPQITVTGAPIAASTPNDATVAGATAPAAPAATNDFRPNLLDMGSTQASMEPMYQRPAFWAVQGSLIGLLIAGGVVIFVRRRGRSDDELAAKAAQRRSILQEEDAMGQAVRQGDARSFFLAARHAVQLQLGSEWKVQPESLTLSEIRARDPQIADVVEPLFNQADEIIYSGQNGIGDLDLPQWERRVRDEILQTA